MSQGGVLYAASVVEGLQLALRELALHLGEVLIVPEG